jgi:hypothetical protein
MVRSVPEHEQDAQSSSWVLYLKTGNIYNSTLKTKTHHGDRFQGVGSIWVGMKNLTLEKQLWIADCFQCSASSHANAAIPNCAATSSGSSWIDRQLQFHRLWSSIVGYSNAGCSEKSFKWCSKVKKAYVYVGFVGFLRQQTTVCKIVEIGHEVRWLSMENLTENSNSKKDDTKIFWTLQRNLRYSPSFYYVNFQSDHWSIKPL